MHLGRGENRRHAKVQSRLSACGFGVRASFSAPPAAHPAPGASQRARPPFWEQFSRQPRPSPSPRPQEVPPPSAGPRAAPPPSPELAPAALGSAWARPGPDPHEVSSRSPGPEGENAERRAQRAAALGKPGPGRRQGGALWGPPEGQLRAAAGARRAREARGRLTHLPSRRRNPCDSRWNSAHIQIPAPQPRGRNHPSPRPLILGLLIHATTQRNLEDLMLSECPLL
nr:basic proline-rich protein-like [Globicephala melas]